MTTENSIDMEAIREITQNNGLNDLIPKIDLQVPAIITEQPEEKDLIEDKELVKMYSDTVENIKKDREEITYYLERFSDLAFNEGDASSSTKEAVVNLLKIKSDTSDKLSKIAELMTRIKLRERDTFPKYLAAQQHNTINIDSKRPLSSEERKKIIQEENKKLKG